MQITNLQLVELLVVAKCGDIITTDDSLCKHRSNLLVGILEAGLESHERLSKMYDLQVDILYDYGSGGEFGELSDDVLDLWLMIHRYFEIYQEEREGL